MTMRDEIKHVIKSTLSVLMMTEHAEKQSDNDTREILAIFQHRLDEIGEKAALIANRSMRNSLCFDNAMEIFHLCTLDAPEPEIDMCSTCKWGWSQIKECPKGCPYMKPQPPTTPCDKSVPEPEKDEEPIISLLLIKVPKGAKTFTINLDDIKEARHGE